MTDKISSPQKLEKSGSVGSNGSHDGLRQRAQEQERLAHASDTASGAVVDTASAVVDTTNTAAKTTGDTADTADTATKTTGDTATKTTGDTGNDTDRIDPIIVFGADHFRRFVDIASRTAFGAEKLVQIADDARYSGYDEIAHLAESAACFPLSDEELARFVKAATSINFNFRATDTVGGGGSGEAGPSTAGAGYVHKKPEMEDLSKVLPKMEVLLKALPEFVDLQLDPRRRLDQDYLKLRYKWHEERCATEELCADALGLYKKEDDEKKESKGEEVLKGEKKEDDAELLEELLSKRRKRIHTNIVRRQTAQMGLVSRQLTGKDPTEKSVGIGSINLAREMEEGDIKEWKKRLKMSEGEPKVIEKERKKDRTAREEKVKKAQENRKLSSSEKEIIIMLEERCKVYGIRDTIEYLKQGENRQLKELYIKHAIYCLGTVVGIKNEENMLFIANAVENVIDHEHERHTKILWNAVKSQHRRNTLKNGDYPSQLRYNVMYWERTAARTLKKQVTELLGAEGLRYNKLLEKYGYLKGNNRHVRELEYMAEILDIGEQYQRTKAELEYAQKRVWDEISILKKDLWKKEYKGDYTDKEIQDRKIEIETAIEKFKQAVVDEEKALEDHTQHLRDVVHKRIAAKYGTHPTRTRVMYVSAISGFLAFALTAALGGHSDYIGTHPASPA